VVFVVKYTYPDPLKLLEVIVKHGQFNDILKLHKMIYTMKKNGVDLGYNFIIYSFGPYSKELDEDLRLLNKLGLITIERKGDKVFIRPTVKGIEICKSMKLSIGMGV